jgi:hypothetical protein
MSPLWLALGALLVMAPRASPCTSDNLYMLLATSDGKVRRNTP